MRKRVSKLTIERLKQAFDYDPETGFFTWKIKIGTAFPGKVVKVIANDEKAPYIYVCIDNERHYAHRLAWFYMTGAWPEKGIDHKNGQHSDNRWENLRQATQRQNICNARLRKDNKAGAKGVCLPTKEKRWVAQLSSKRIGSFSTKEEAQAAYAEAAKKAYGEFFREI